MAKSAFLIVPVLAIANAAWAGDRAGDDGRMVEPVIVVGVSPLPGAGVDIDKAPSNIQTLSAADLTRGGPASLTGALTDRLGSVSVNDNLDNPFQPDILLRGFEASPVLGTPQGVAVYQNGVRINEAFGDTVNWDLIPSLAIRRLDVVSGSPVFGLNALGGAVALAMKTGFTDPGGDASISGGSFGRWDAAAEFGANNGVLSAYVAARALDENGWREFSANRLRQFYGDLGARSASLSLDLAVGLADNYLNGESATPVQELAVNRSLVFTSPQSNDNSLASVTLNLDYSATPTLSFQGVAYYRGFSQSLINGNTTPYVACDPPNVGQLCQGDGLTPLAGPSGQPIPDISNGGATPIGENDRETISTNGAGASLQATSTAPLLGHENHFSTGATLDSAATDFASSAEVGVINAALQVMSSGLFVYTPQNPTFTATPVRLNATTTYLGVYASDTIDLGPRLAVTLSGRFNGAWIDLNDRLGTYLNGANYYSRFNPALGATYAFNGSVTAYGGYSEGARAPNASEIECSNPLLPCLLPSSLASDPPTLKQVVARTWEAGLRGRAAWGGGRITWNAGGFWTDVQDDIYGVATSLSAGYFQNIPDTRRAGVELGARYEGPRLTAYASYSLVDATFQSAFSLPSPSNPFRDAQGNIQVRPGDRLPGIPLHRLKLGADLEVRRNWSVGATLALVSSAYYQGDASNQLAPLPGYAVVGLQTTLDITRWLELFVEVDNALNAQYATFGVLGDPTGVGAPGVPPPGPAVNPRFQSPASPIAAYGGLRFSF